MLCVAVNTVAQNEDSLLSIIEGNYPDSTRIKTQLFYAQLVRNNQPQKAIEITEDASMLSIQTKEYLLAGQAFNQLGLFYYFDGDYKNSKANFQESGVYYELANEPKGIANSSNNTGVVAYEQGYYFEALDLYAKALVIRKSIGDSVAVAVSYNNIGNVYKDIGDLSKAKEYYEQSIEFKTLLNDSYGLAMTYNNLGLVHHEEKEYDLAIQRFEKSIELKKEIGDEFGLGMSYANLGNTLLNLGRVEEALKNVQQSIEWRTKVVDNQGLLHSNLILAKIYYEQANYTDCQSVAKTVLDSAVNYGANVQIRDAYSVLADVSDKIGNYKDAFFYQKQYSIWSDSLLNQENLRSTQQLEKDLELQEKQDEIAQLQSKVNNASPITSSTIFWSLIAVSISLLLILATVLIFKAKDDENEESNYDNSKVSSLRIIAGVAAIFPIIYGYLKPIDIPNALDPFEYRLVFSGLFLAVFISTYISSWARNKIQTIAIIASYIFSFYLLFMAFLNEMNFSYFVDSVLVLLVIPAVFNKRLNALLFILIFNVVTFTFYYYTANPQTTLLTISLLVLTASGISFLVVVSKNNALKELNLANQIVNEADALVYIANEEGKHIYTSNSITTILGYSPEEVTDGSFWKKAGISERNKGKIRKYLSDLASGRIEPKPNQYHKYISKSGQEKWILWKDKRIDGNRALGVGQDVTETKIIQDKLIERESIFSQINDSLNETFYLYNIQKQKYEFISENCINVMGADQQFFFDGKSHTANFVHPLDKEMVFQAKEKIENGESYQIDYRIVIDDQIRWVRESSQPIFSVKNEIVKNSGICKDITEEKKIEEEMEKLSMVASLTSNYIIIAHAEDGIEWVNDSFIKKFGYKLEECTGRFPSELMHFKPDSAVVKLINEVVFEHQNNFNGEMIHTTKDGRPIQAQVDIIPFVIENGKVVKYFVLGSDITAQKEQEELILQSHKDLKTKERLLSESEGNFRQLIRSIKEVFWLTDYKTKELLFVSNSFEDVFNYTVDEFKENPRIWANNIHPDDKEIVVNQFLKFVENPLENEVNIDFKLVQNNKTRWLKARMFPIVNEQNEVIKLSGLAEDITEQKLQENDLKFLNRKLDIINSIEKSILSSESRDQIIYNALSTALSKLPILRASLALFDYSSKEFHSFTLKSDGAQSLTDKRVFKLKDFSVLGEMQKNKSNILTDISKKEVKSKTDELLLEEGVTLTSMSPLLKENELIGSFNVCFTEQLEAEVETYIDICTEIAQGLGVAISQAQLKEEITEKNKDILGSISYAQRIQESLIPKELANNGALSDYFIYYRPKDIVSGDFYFSTVHENQLVLVVGDCTGHGVPGGFMTVLGITHLERILSLKTGMLNPSEILEELDEAIISSLSSDRTTQLTDGMDVGVVIINQEHKRLCYASARRPLLKIRNTELEIINGSKRSIGDSLSQYDFNTNTMEYESGDQFYIFSDGIPDQFGGPETRKINRRRVQETLMSLSSKPMYRQKNLLNEFMQEWQGENEQTDDMVLVGFKLK